MNRYNVARRSLWLMAVFWILVVSAATTATAAVAADEVYLPVIAGGAGQTTTPTPETPTPVTLTPETPTPITPTPVTPTPITPTPIGGWTSEGKIALALHHKEIDAETALLYRVYANFADSRLPAQYVGDDSQAAPSSVLEEAQERWAQLSPATQQLITPFLLPPSASGNWLEQQVAAHQQLQAASPMTITWATTCKTSSVIKVWYQARFPEDADDAQQICDLVSNSIWPQLEQLLGRVPLPDDKATHTGGDGRLDIYLAPAKTTSIALAGCSQSPAYLLINHRSWNKAQVAQVMMSAFLLSYERNGCQEYRWLSKATLVWAIDYLFPDDQSEHRAAENLLKNTNLPLNTADDIVFEDDAGNLELYRGGYGAYLWLFFTTHHSPLGNAAVRHIWEAATHSNSLAAVESALGSGWFKQSWNVFSTMNWNHAPATNYQQWDNFLPHATPWLAEAVELDGQSSFSYMFLSQVDYLSARTYRFQFTDPNVHSVYFINPFYNGSSPTAHVDAFVKIEGKPWELQSWTTAYGKGFCRDLKAERLEELVIVISNHEWQDRTHKLRPAYPPRLNFTNIACRGWQVQASVTYQEEGPDLHVSTVANTQFTFVPMASEGGVSNHPYFNAVDASGTWEHTHTHASCHGAGSGAFARSGKVYSSFFHVHAYATDYATGTTYERDLRGFTGFAGSAREWPYEYKCPNETHSMFADLAWFQTDSEPVFQVHRDGQTITGKYIRIDERSTSLATTTWEWKMTALPPE